MHFMHSKKAQGLPLNVIIIAVLVLIVLVVLVVIFSGKLGKFSTQTSESEKAFSITTCDIPGTGRYCANACEFGDTNAGLKGFKCIDESKGKVQCCQKG